MVSHSNLLHVVIGGDFTRGDGTGGNISLFCCLNCTFLDHVYTCCLDTTPGRVVPKSYQQEGQPRKTENELMNDWSKMV